MLLRDFVSDDLERGKRFLEQIVEAAQAAHPRAAIDLEIENSYRP